MHVSPTLSLFCLFLLTYFLPLLARSCMAASLSLLHCLGTVDGDMRVVAYIITEIAFELSALSRGKVLVTGRFTEKRPVKGSLCPPKPHRWRPALPPVRQFDSNDTRTQNIGGDIISPPSSFPFIQGPFEHFRRESNARSHLRKLKNLSLLSKLGSNPTRVNCCATH